MSDQFVDVAGEIRATLAVLRVTCVELAEAAQVSPIFVQLLLAARPVVVGGALVRTLDALQELAIRRRHEIDALIPSCAARSKAMRARVFGQSPSEPPTAAAED